MNSTGARIAPQALYPHRAEYNADIILPLIVGNQGNYQVDVTALGVKHRILSATYAYVTTVASPATLNFVPLTTASNVVPGSPVLLTIPTLFGSATSAANYLYVQWY